MKRDIKFTVIDPGRKIIKSTVIRIVFFILGRAFQAASLLDSVVKKEIGIWPDNFVIVFDVLPAGPSMVIRKENGRLIFRGLRKQEGDLVISFKNIESAFMIFTAQKGFAGAYAEHRLAAKGNIADSMALIRIADIVQALLFPKFIAKRILKKVPEIGLKRWGIRLVIYLVAVPFGLIR